MSGVAACRGAPALEFLVPSTDLRKNAKPRHIPGVEQSSLT